MPVAAKKADQYMDMLNDVLQSGSRIGDIDRFHINDCIKKTMNANPVDGLLLKAMLAHIDGKINESRSAFESAITIDSENPFVHTNYARMLSDSGFSSDATKEIRKALDCCKKSNQWMPLGYLAASAFSVHDIDALSEISKIAKKLGLSDDIFLHAAIACEMEGATDDECFALIEDKFQNDTLRRLSVEITPDRWAEMTALADRFSKYVE